jgi:hypothetical protein
MVPVVSLGLRKGQKAISIKDSIRKSHPYVVRDDSRQAPAPIPDLVPFCVIARLVVTL